MRSFVFVLSIFLLIKGVHGVCDYGSQLLDWSDKPVIPMALGNTWETDMWGNPLYPGANITGMYATIDSEYLYLKIEVSEAETITENIKYTFELYPQKENIEYYRFAINCDELIDLAQKPQGVALINITVGSGWESAKSNFNISVHPHSVEVKIPLEYLNSPDSIGLNIRAHYNSSIVNQGGLSEWPFYLCPTTSMVCGNGVCDDSEGQTGHPCVCPTDCESSMPCAVGSPMIDWAGAILLNENQDDKLGGYDGKVNGSDLIALKAKVDYNNLYLKFDLDEKETPHQNITYSLRFNPNIGGVDYITLRIRCDEVYEMMEKNNNFVTATNYTSTSAWQSIKNNFTVAVTEHAVEVKVPWYIIYKVSGMNVEVASYFGSTRVNDMYANVEDISSLFGNTCGDGTCSEEEENSLSRYQYCAQDCPPMELPWANGICEPGEDDRWGYQQSAWDCRESFTYLDVGKYDEPTNNGDDIFGPLVGIALIVVVFTLAYRGVKRIYFKATAGVRKSGDLKKRKTEIGKEREGLQAKFLETRISEEQFHKQMTELDREEQNINLELKK